MPFRSIIFEFSYHFCSSAVQSLTIACLQDYHVILLRKRDSRCPQALVYDLDTSLQFPCPFEEYFEKTTVDSNETVVQYRCRSTGGRFLVAALTEPCGGTCRFSGQSPTSVTPWKQHFRLHVRQHWWFFRKQISFSKGWVPTRKIYKPPGPVKTRRFPRNALKGR